MGGTWQDLQLEPEPLTTPTSLSQRALDLRPQALPFPLPLLSVGVCVQGVAQRLHVFLGHVSPAGGLGHRWSKVRNRGIREATPPGRPLWAGPALRHRQGLAQLLAPRLPPASVGSLGSSSRATSLDHSACPWCLERLRRWEVRGRRHDSRWGFGSGPPCWWYQSSNCRLASSVLEVCLFVLLRLHVSG